MINETTNLNTNVTIKDTNNVDTVVMYLGATLDSGNMNLNISVNTTNKVLAKANAVDVKAQYDEFVAVVAVRAKELGYVIL